MKVLGDDYSLNQVATSRPDICGRPSNRAETKLLRPATRRPPPAVLLLTAAMNNKVEAFEHWHGEGPAP